MAGQTDFGNYRKPQAANADTTYGSNQSLSNNYGLGSGFKSAKTKALQTRAQAAAQESAPSWWWLLAFAAMVVIL